MLHGKPLLYLMVVGLAVCWGPRSGYSRVLQVPGDYTTIQGALDAAMDGDEIVVYPGRYVENVHISGKNLVLRSADPTSTSVVAATILDGGRRDSVVTFAGTEGTTCVLEGFTIAYGNRLYPAVPTDGERWGGGIAGNGTLATLQDNVITSNTAESGGGLAECNGPIFRNVVSSNKVAGGGGGGLLECDGIIRENTIVGNEARDGSGGGLAFCNGLIEGNTILDNCAVSSNVSPLWVYGGGLLRCDGMIRGNIIAGNRAHIEPSPYPTKYAMLSFGGGLYGCHGVIQANTIVDNEGRYGAGIYSSDATIEGNVIEGNYASFGGGGLMYCSGWVQDNRIEGNFGRLGGGIAYCQRVRNNVIRGNRAGEGGGGVLSGDDYHNESILNNVIYGNSATEFRWSEGGGIALNSSWSKVLLYNNVIYGNSAPSNPQAAGDFWMSYNCVEGWAADEEGNFGEDPLFADAANGDFHLRADSPCIDAGGLTLDVLNDLEGNPRPQDGVSGESRGDGSQWDIGAYEYPGATLPTPAPDATLIRDVLLKRTLPQYYMDLNGDGAVDAADLVEALR